MSYPGYSLRAVLNPLQRCSRCILQSQATGPPNTHSGILTLCRDAVGVFYSPPPSWLANNREIDVFRVSSPYTKSADHCYFIPNYPTVSFRFLCIFLILRSDHLIRIVFTFHNFTAILKCPWLLLTLSSPVGWSCRIIDCISAEGLYSPNECPGYDIKQSELRLQQCWCFGECRVLIHCNCSKIYSIPEW